MFIYPAQLFCFILIGLFKVIMSKSRLPIPVFSLYISMCALQVFHFYIVELCNSQHMMPDRNKKINRTVNRFDFFLLHFAPGYKKKQT